MNLSSVGRASAIGVAISLSAGCGGSSQGQPTIPTTSSSIRQADQHGTSWMLATAKNENLLYITGACGGTCVFSYPAGELVGSLNVGDAGACADSASNVYVANQTQLLKYAHGGKSPISTFTLSSGSAVACSIDKVTGNVAVTILGSPYFSVAVFPASGQLPATFMLDGAAYAGYDNQGNLFVDTSDQSGTLGFYELPKGGTSFKTLSISQPLSIRPGQVQWDGKYMTIEGFGIPFGIAIYRLSVSGSEATVKSVVKIRGPKTGGQSWIYRKRLFLPYSLHRVENELAGAWAYPKGGKAKVKIRKLEQGANYQGIVYSPDR